MDTGKFLQKQRIRTHISLSCVHDISLGAEEQCFASSATTLISF
jgi:hypothetical protein